MNKRRLQDVTGWSSNYTINEGKEDSDSPLIISGVFGKVDEVNGNQRVYPRKVIESQLREKRELISSRGMFGNLDHPEQSEVKVSEASHIVTKLELDGSGHILGELEVLRGPYGSQLEAIARAGGRIGLSTRGLGSTKKNKDGIQEVQEDYELITVDVVANPSAPGAFGSVSESQEKEEIQEMSKKAFKEYKRRVGEVLELEIDSMSESERSRAVSEAESLVIDLETDYLEESGYRSATKRLIERLQDFSEKVSESDSPTPGKRIEASFRVIEELRSLLVKKERDLQEVAENADEWKSRYEAAEEIGEETLSQFKETKRQLAIATEMGERLLRMCKEKKSVSGAVEKMAQKVVEENEHLSPMLDRLRTCESVEALEEMVKELEDFYSQSSHPMIEKLASNSTKKVRQKKSPREDKKLTEEQKEQQAILNGMLS